MSEIIRVTQRYSSLAIALPLAAILSTTVSHQAMAACVGSVNPLVQAQTATANNGTSVTVECGVATPNTNFPSAPASPASDGDVTVNANDTATYKDTSTQGTVGTAWSASNPNTVNNVLLQFDGHGRTLDVKEGALISNERVINGTNGGRGRTAVVMGQSTVNAGNGTTLTAGAFSSGSNSTTVTLTPTFTSAAADALKGQSLVLGNFDGDDFTNGVGFEILSVTKTETSPGSGVFNVVVSVRGNASGYTASDNRYSVVSNYGVEAAPGFNNVIHNAGTIKSKIGATEITDNVAGSGTTKTSPSYTGAVIAVDTRVAGTYLIDNKAGGTISATHDGIGLVQGIFEGGQVTSMTVENAGTIAIERTARLTLDSVTANNNPTAKSPTFSDYAAQTVGNAWTIATEEEAEEIIINNAATGIISSKGDYTATIYSRVEEASITNYGLIEHQSGASTTSSPDYSKGFAIGGVSNGGGLREMELTNYGTIHGDILGVNSQAVRWYMLSTEGVVTSGFANLAAGQDARLVINSQNGQQNSEIENKKTGTIIGNLYFSNGEHEVENEGKIVGNFDIDQRATLVNGNQAATCTNSGGTATTTGCTGSATGSSSVTVSAPSAITSEDDPTKEVSKVYTVTRTTAYGTDTSKITNNVTVTAGDRKFELENEGSIKGNIFVNQDQSNIYALPDLAAVCTKTGATSGVAACSGSTGTPVTSAAASATGTDGTIVTSTATTTLRGGSPTAASTPATGTTGSQVALSNVSIDLTSSHLDQLTREFNFTNSGTFEGDITIKDNAASKNTITLIGDGFGRTAEGAVNSATGKISAVNGAGDNTLNLLGEGTLRNDVSKFKTLNVGELGGGGGGGDNDDDDDDGAGSGGTDWTLLSGKTFEFAAANLLSGSLDVRGTLKGNTTVGEDATLLGRGNIIGNVTNNGTIDLDDETLNVTGNVSLNDDSKLALAIADGEHGKLAVTGTMSIDDDSTVAPVLDGVMVYNGDSFTVATTTGGITGLPEVSQFALLHWEAELANASKDLVITAEVADAGDIERVSQPGAAAINTLLGFENDLGIALLGIEDEEDVARAAAQLAPETNFATQQAAITLNQSIGQNIDTRLASAGATGGNFGGASGLGGPMGLGMSQKASEGRSNLGYSDDPDFVAPRSAALWGQAFGAGLDQDTRQLVDGYDARLYGLMAGYDNLIASNTRLGVAVGYANTNIDGQGFTSRNTTDIDSYLVEVYGATKGAGWYVAGRTGFTWHNYDTARAVTIPVSETETGSHDGQQFNASVEIGAPTRMSGAVVTPVASLTYSYLDQDGYVENGGLAAQTVGSQTNDSLVSGLGLKALIPIAHDTVLEGRAVWLHEFADTAQTVTASFAAGGGQFTASGPDVGRDTAALGVGLIANVDQDSTFQLNYDANVRQDFIGHVGSVRLTIGF